MTTLREHISHERRRLRQVRTALSTAVAKGANGDESYVPFYLAIGDYMETSMGRLDDQDVYMGKLLEKKIPNPNAEEKKALAELWERLRINQEHLKKFVAARDALKAKGAAALDEYEAAAKAYTDYIVASMGHHGGSTNLAQAHFSQDEWNEMAGVTDASIAKEKELFDRVFAAKPANLTLEAAE